MSASGADFAHAVAEGFRSRPRSLSSVWHYDALGSMLFEAICLLPEYELTRIENELIADHADAMIDTLGRPGEIVELGSGAALKTIALLRAAQRREQSVCYRPVDVSGSALDAAQRRLAEACPGLAYAPILGDYFSLLKQGLPKTSQQRLVLFLGSNVGNYEPPIDLELLTALFGALQPGDGFLLGAALQRPHDEIQAAYDDPLGVTCAFNKNVLARINRELEGDFNLHQFSHQVEYDEDRGVVNSYLVSQVSQRVRVGALDCEFEFEAGERIHTEYSSKYTLASICQLGETAGFRWVAQWADEKQRFCDVLFRVE